MEACGRYQKFAGYEAAFTGYYVKRASVKVESKRGYAATRIEDGNWIFFFAAS